MRCKTCHYSLSKLTEHRCPECGRAFDPNDPSTFLSGREPDPRLRHVKFALLAILCAPFLVWFWELFPALLERSRGGWFDTLGDKLFLSGAVAILDWSMMLMSAFVLFLLFEFISIVRGRRAARL